MRVKASMAFLFENAAWSETLYFTGSDFENIHQRFDPIFTARRRLLSTEAVIDKLRLVNIDGRALGQLFNVQLAGQGGGADTPWQAVQINFNSAIGVRRRYHAAGLPDAFTAAGHFARNTVFTDNGNRRGSTIVGAYAQALVTQQAQIAYADRAQPKIDIASIDANGNVVVLADLTTAIGDSIQFIRTQYDGGREFVKGRWRVESFTDARHFKLLHWPTGRTVSKGRLYKVVPLLTNMSTFSIGDTMSRTTGRPSGRQVGRRSTRR